MITRMRRILNRTVQTLQYQLRKGAFTPENFELSFQMTSDLDAVNISLSEEERMQLIGRIDRVDTCRREDKLYVKIIDYKSGNRKFDLAALYYGLQLQLVVYLNAAMDTLKNRQQGEVHPAGMFYYHIEDPLLDYEESADPEQKLLKALAWNGLANGDRRVLELMDREMLTGSDVLPVRLKKDGGYTAASSVADDGQFELLARHVQRKLLEYGERILKGDIRMTAL